MSHLRYKYKKGDRALYRISQYGRTHEVVIHSYQPNHPDPKKRITVWQIISDTSTLDVLLDYGQEDLTPLDQHQELEMGKHQYILPTDKAALEIANHLGDIICLPLYDVNSIVQVIGSPILYQVEKQIVHESFFAYSLKPINTGKKTKRAHLFKIMSENQLRPITDEELIRRRTT